MLGTLSYCGAVLPLAFCLCQVVFTVASNCELEGGYDYDILKSAIWRIAPEDDKCDSKKQRPCSWYFQFCNKLPSNPCGRNVSCEMPSNTSFGEFTTFLAEGPQGFSANFASHRDNQTCPTFNTNLLFRCNQDKHISIGNDTEVARLHHTDIKLDKCVRNVTVEFAGACAPLPPPQGLSTGSVILILFFVALLLYLVIGVVVNHSNGARGWEMIPHYLFWTELPLLIVEGCVFFVKLVTCQANRGQSGSYDDI